MASKKSVLKAVLWLSDEIQDPNCLNSTFRFYEKFQYQDMTCGIGDYVLISNADAADSDTEAGCDPAQILTLYEDPSNKNDPFRAKVQWYSRFNDIPKWCFNNNDPINFFNREVIEDHRAFNSDVSIETFYKKCDIKHTFTKDIDDGIKKPFHYICRYRLMVLSKKKTYLEPVLEQERNALSLFRTPIKRESTSTSRTPKTPNTLIKGMNRISLSEKNWSVSKNNGTKLLLKRAILTDMDKDLSINSTLKSTKTVKCKMEPESPRNDSPRSKKTVLAVKSPKRVSPKYQKRLSETPKSLRKSDKLSLEEAVSLELQVNSDDELPTLIIRHAPPSPKRKLSGSKPLEVTPKKKSTVEAEMETIFTRSGRSIKKPVNYMDVDVSPVKKSSRRVGRKSTDSDDDFEQTPKTPRTPITPRNPRTNQTPKRSTSKRIPVRQLTPMLQARAHSVERVDEFLKETESLPGRESHLEEILSFVKTNIVDGASGCMYISGVPGTGKTATVCLALKMLKEDTDVPDFALVEVNGMQITAPRQAYVHIYKKLTGKTVVWEQACALLSKRFTSPGTKRTPTVLLVDELDALCNRRQDVVYNVMEWASHRSAMLSVIAVANTLDLPERALEARVASRLGLTRLAFAPYTHAQLQRIVANRLARARLTPDAIQLIARKVAAVSGDARRALALCTRALELSGPDGAGLKEVERALVDAMASATVRAIRCCSGAERLMLKAVAAEVERTGSEETTLSRALANASALTAIEGRPYKSALSIRAPTPSQAQEICARLAASRLLLMELKPTGPRLILNISVDDVHYATRQCA